MSRERLEAVMALPEAVGRRPLAEHLATKTDLSLKQIRENLSAAHADPVAIAQEVLDAHRAVRGRQEAPPAFTPKTPAENEAEEMGDQIVALHRRHGPARKKKGEPMTTARRQRAADPDPAPEPAERTSAAVQADIDALRAQEAEADALLKRLEAERPDVLRSGDDAAAERHDAEIARARRTIERQDLLNPATFKTLERALGEALAREEAERRAAQQAAATAKVEALVAEFPEQYRAAALEIQRLMVWWAQVQDEAAAAGVQTPHSVFRVRADREIEPARERTYKMRIYTDPDTGRVTPERFPYIAVSGEDPPPDPKTGELPCRIAIGGNYSSASFTSKGTKVWPNPSHLVDVPKTIPAVIERGFCLPDLLTAVALPPLTEGDPRYWPMPEAVAVLARAPANPGTSTAT